MSFQSWGRGQGFKSQNGKIDENEVQVPTQNNVCAHTHTICIIPIPSSTKENSCSCFYPPFPPLQKDKTPLLLLLLPLRFHHSSIISFHSHCNCYNARYIVYIISTCTILEYYFLLLLLLFTKHFYHVVKGSISHQSLTSLFFFLGMEVSL